MTLEASETKLEVTCESEIKYTVRELNSESIEHIDF